MTHRSHLAFILPIAIREPRETEKTNLWISLGHESTASGLLNDLKDNAHACFFGTADQPQSQLYSESVIRKILLIPIKPQFVINIWWKFCNDRTRIKSLLRRLKNIGVVSQKQYRNTLIRVRDFISCCLCALLLDCVMASICLNFPRLRVGNLLFSPVSTFYFHL